MKKIISFVSLLGLLLNSFATPLSVIAQDTIDAPVTQEAVITPVDDTAPLPEQSVIDLPSPTPEILSTTTEESTPAPTDEPPNTMPPESLPTTPGPPGETPPQAPDDITGSETLTETFIENINLSEVSEINSNVLDSGTITTDKPDYSPGSVAVISGSGFLPNKSYSIEITADKDYSFIDHNIQADSDGNIQYLYTLDTAFHPLYTVNIKSGEVVVATLTFTDANDQLNQCANGTLASPDLTPCQSGSEWENGNLGASKSHYYEGDTIPYRLTMEGLSTSDSHTVTIEWDTTQTDIHAIDYITSFNNTVNADPCAGVSGCSTYDSYPIPSDPQVTAALVTPIPGSFRLYGGDITSVGTYSYPAGSGFTGNKNAQITLTFTTSVANPVLAWGGHIASRSDWGNTVSAISISGSPYHMRLIDIDGKGGNMDRSLSADAVIFPASITIIKAANPEGSTSFPFTASPSPLTNFSLVDDGTAANISTFSGITNFQTYTVTENTPSGWSLDGVVCSVTSPNGGSQSINGATATIDLKEGENVTCTFTNSVQLGTLTVQKTTIPTLDPAMFTINATGSGTITGGGAGSISDSTDQSYTVTAGTYYVSETVPTGWSKTGDTCQGVVVGAGETKSCTITNTKLGKIIVEKQTLPNGSLQSFNFTPSYGSGFSLTDGQTNTSIFLSPGFYSVSESVPDGWTQTSAICADGSPVNAIELAAGETVNCTFNNTQKGQIVVDKATNPSGSQQSFSFTTTGTGYSGFSLKDADAPNNQEVVPGSYSVSETSVTGWDSNGGICDSGETPANLDVEPGETVTCTFTNTLRGSISGYKYDDANGNGVDNSDWTPVTGWVIELWQDGVFTGQTATTSATGFYSFTNLVQGAYQLIEQILSGWAKVSPISGMLDITLSAGENDTGNNFVNTQYGTIIIEKQTVPDRSTEVFDFDTNFGIGDADLSDGQQSTVGSLLPTNYSITETPKTGWQLTDTTCTSSKGDTEIASDLELDSGETITCVFTNSKLPTLTLVKTVENDDGGKATAADFQGKIDGINVSWGVAQTLNPDDYTASETTTLSGYLASDWGTDCSSDGSVTLNYGDNKTCTITNDDQPGQIKIIKETVGGNGTFGFDITGPSTSSPNVTTSGNIGDTGFISVDAGNYSISEDAKTGWKLTGSSCDFGTPEQFSVSNGGTVTCTFTNTKYGFMQGRKYLDNNLNGRLDLAESGTFQNNWTIRLYDSNWQPKETQLTRILMDPSGGQYRFENLLPGTYYACEVLPVGWQQMGPVLGSHAVNYDNIQVNGSIAVINGSGVPGEGPVCWQSNINGDEFGWLGFGNIQKGHIIVDKVTDPSEDMQSFSFDATGNGYADFTLTDQDPPNDQELLPGIYTISEADVNGWELESASCISSIKDSESVSRLDLDPGETITCTFNNLKLDPKISITKSNNLSGGITAGTTVTYTINIKNDGNVYIYDIDITDILPGGFTYVLGSTTGAITSDPVVAGGKLTWENVGDLGVGEFLTISYQAKTGMDISNGTYINIASCGAKYGKRPETGPYLTDFQENIISCRTVSSAVTVGSTQGYGGNLAGQVLGISTELPATGNPTWMLIAAFAALGAGIYLNVYAKKKTKNVKK